MQINSRNTSLVIGTDAVIVSEKKQVSTNAERVRLILMNNSTAGQVITVTVDADPVAGAGIVIAPGGSIQWERQSIPIQQGRVLAIADAAGGTLSVYEEVLQ
jgi:hypothetical protein